MQKSYFSFGRTEQAKIHINLPAESWEIIENDMVEFSSIDYQRGYSNFINRIVCTYIDERMFPARIKERTDAAQTAIESVLSSLNKVEKKTKDQLIKALKESCMKEIYDEYNPPKDIGNKIDLNNACKQALNDVSMYDGNEIPAEMQVFDTPGLYIRAIMLDYTRKSQVQRSYIYKQQEYEYITRSIKEKRSINVKSLGPNGTLIANTIIPYAVVTDMHEIHSYLVGIYENKRTTDDIFLLSFTKIVSISFENSGSTLTKEEKKVIKEKISQNGISHLREKVDYYTVKLTKQGEKQLKTISYQRPRMANRSEEDKRNGVYTFICSKYQLKNYLRRLGKDAVIISPQGVHDEMLNEYKLAYEAYSKTDLL